MSKEENNMETTTKTKFSVLASPEKDTTSKRQKTTKQTDNSKNTNKSKTDQPANLEDIKSALLPIQQALKDLSLQFQTFGDSFSQIISRMEKSESKIIENEIKIDSISQRTDAHDKEIQNLQAKLTDLEARSRRNNIIIRGIPETVLHNNLIPTIKQIINSLLEESEEMQQITIERAHRALREMQTSLKPRPVYIKILNYQDVNKIILAAKKKGTLTWNNNKISFAQDLPIQIRQARQLLSPYCRFLIEKKSNSR